MDRHERAGGEGSAFVSRDPSTRGGGRSVIPVFIGLLFVVYGVSQPLLLLVGTRGSAVITSVRRQGGSLDRRPNDYWWVAGYDFKALDGKRYSGSARSLGTSFSSMRFGKGQVEPVLYLRSFPWWNALQKCAEPSLGHGVIVGGGVFLIWLSRRRPGGKRRKPKERRLVPSGREGAPAEAAFPGRVMTAEETLAWAGSYRTNSRRYAWIFLLVLVPVVVGVIRLSTGEWNEDVLYSAAAFIVVTGLLAFFSRRGTEGAWRGTVEGKAIRRETRRRHDDGPAETVYIPVVVFRTDTGKRVKLRVSRDLYEYFREGERVVKIAGFDWPEKEESAPEDRRVCIACGNVLEAGEVPCSRCRAPVPDLEALLR